MVYHLFSQRLELRPLSLADDMLVKEILCEPELMVGFGGPLAETAIRPWLQENIRRYQQDGYSYLFVLERATNQFVGLVGLLKENDDADDFTGVAYVLKSAFQGLGYGQEALETVMSYGFNQLNLTEIGAQIEQTNRASRKLIVKLGFEVEKYFSRELAGVKYDYIKYLKKKCNRRD